MNLQVQLDTGSSDLFLDTQNASFTNANDTGLTATLVYGYVCPQLKPHGALIICCRDSTVAEGPILLAPVQFGNFSVPSQAFGE